MQILDIPQSGKRGLNVSQGGRYGQVSHALVVPANPRIPAQMNVRAIFAAISAQWRGLTDAKRVAWDALASTMQTRKRLGQSGPMTGSQLFNKVNCTNQLTGAAVVTDPPAKPTFPALAVTGIVITNTGGVIAIKATCPSDPGENTFVRACAPQSAGRNVCSAWRLLGTLPTPTAGACNITTMFTSVFGVPPVRRRIFLQSFQILDGYESIPTSFNGLVPES